MTIRERLIERLGGGQAMVDRLASVTTLRDAALAKVKDLERDQRVAVELIKQLESERNEMRRRLDGVRQAISTDDPET